MKRLLVLCLCILMVLPFVACNGDAPSTVGTGVDTSVLGSDQNAVSQTDTGEFSNTDTALTDAFLTGDTVPDSAGNTDGSTDTENNTPTDTAVSDSGSSSGGTSERPATNTSSGSTVSTPTTDTSSGGTSTSDTGTPWVPRKVVDDKVIAIDQYKKRVVIYNLSNMGQSTDLDGHEEWYYTFSGAGVKYREDTVFGDVILLCGNNNAQIVSYPSKRTLWNIDTCIDAHSIEILPSGNVVLASAIDGGLWLYTSSLGKYDEGKQFDIYPLEDAHGVLWDPEYNCLWAIGKSELVSYTVLGTGPYQTLVEKEHYTLPDLWGHDLSADLTDTRYLYVSDGNGAHRFDKLTGVFYSQKHSVSAMLDHSDIKGYGNNQNGNFFFTYPNGGPGTPWEDRTPGDIAAWCTNTISVGREIGRNTYQVVSYTSKTYAFYKVRVFYGKYQ